MNYTAVLTEAIAEAKSAGLGPEAVELEAVCFQVAYTTSTELLGEHGIAIRRFLKATRGRLPRATRDKLEDCLVEVARVWPGWWNLPVLVRSLFRRL